MNLRLTLATFALIALCPRPSLAADNTEKIQEKEDARLAGKCAKEALKEVRDGERGRIHAQPENKWDELCAPPAPPVEPPAILPPPLPLPPPGVEPLLPPPLLPPPLPSQP